MHALVPPLHTEGLSVVVRPYVFLDAGSVPRLLVSTMSYKMLLLVSLFHISHIYTHKHTLQSLLSGQGSGPKGSQCHHSFHLYKNIKVIM